MSSSRRWLESGSARLSIRGGVNWWRGGSKGAWKYVRRANEYFYIIYKEISHHSPSKVPAPPARILVLYPTSAVCQRNRCKPGNYLYISCVPRVVRTICTWSLAVHVPSLPTRRMVPVTFQFVDFFKWLNLHKKQKVITYKTDNIYIYVCVCVRVLKPHDLFFVTGVVPVVFSIDRFTQLINWSNGNYLQPDLSHSLSPPPTFLFCFGIPTLRPRY